MRGPLRCARWGNSSGMRTARICSQRTLRLATHGRRRPSCGRGRRPRQRAAASSAIATRVLRRQSSGFCARADAGARAGSERGTSTRLRVSAQAHASADARHHGEACAPGAGGFVRSPAPPGRERVCRYRLAKRSAPVRDRPAGDGDAVRRSRSYRGMDGQGIPTRCYGGSPSAVQVARVCCRRSIAPPATAATTQRRRSSTRKQAASK